MKRIINVVMTIIISCALVCITGCAAFDKEKEVVDDNGSTEVGKRAENLENLTEDNLFFVSIESNDEENIDEDVEVTIYFDSGKICSGKRKELRNAEGESQERILTEEQCEELKKKIVDYSHIVEEKEEEYWPSADEHTEIPEMAVKFRYEIWFGDDEHYEKYRQNGALCYPDDWDVFIEDLLAY